MRKLIAGINMTLDGDCNHTSQIADDELHQHYTELLRNAGTMLYGRVTYQLMESYWPIVVKNPTGEKATDDFAIVMQNISKIVFSHTLKNVEWKNATLAKRGLQEEIVALKQQEGKDIIVGSPSLIVASLNLGLVDEFQICVMPVISGSNRLPLFKNITDRIDLKLLKTKNFGSGAVIFYYAPIKK
jgi:dihydrofolate reductase